ncbi:hypothetical protein HanRHA438_Chr07g0316611 [Helianthus annuus]|nr:hypothetical protein HanRHA438_Chr07g0316611 [Helianthus annuus]
MHNYRPQILSLTNSKPKLYIFLFGIGTLEKCCHLKDKICVSYFDSVLVCDKMIYIKT